MSHRKDCGCSTCNSSRSRSFNTNRDCCNNSISSPPTECCETHVVQYYPGVCLYPVSSVTAVDPDVGDGTFSITFENIPTLPMNQQEVFLYHQAVGKLKIIGRSNNDLTYDVQLVNGARAGYEIKKDDCVMVVVDTGASDPSTSAVRCLVGPFSVPAVNGSRVAYIYNGAGIPIGSTITFNDNTGETGSYLVTEFLGSSNNVYTYILQNTGSGHTPSSIIDGGAAGDCTIPIDLVTNVDVCDLSESPEADNLTGCLNGSPVAFIFDQPGYGPTTKEGGGLTWTKAPEVDCCVFTETVLKFAGESCIAAADTVVLKNINLDCFQAAWDAAEEADQLLVGNIAGVPVVFSAWTGSTTRQATIEPVDPDYANGGPFVEYALNTAICLGPCCDQCTNGPQVSSSFTEGGGDATKASTFIYTMTGLNFDATAGNQRVWLVGANTSGVTTKLELTSTWNDDLEAGIGKPSHSDPLLFRQKICNTHPRGCDQEAQIEYNFEFSLDGMVTNLLADWEIGTFNAGSNTLADGVTPNPFFNISSQSVVTGRVFGPSYTDITILNNTSLGYGNTSTSKIYPFIADSFKDRFILRQCDCANSIVWFVIRFTSTATVSAGTVNLSLAIRRVLSKNEWNLIDLPSNEYDMEGFNS